MGIVFTQLGASTVTAYINLFWVHVHTHLTGSVKKLCSCLTSSFTTTVLVLFSSYMNLLEMTALTLLGFWKEAYIEATLCFSF